MALISKINDLLAEAAAEGVDIGTLAGQVVQVYNNQNNGYPTYSWTQWDYISPTNFFDTVAWIGGASTMPFDVAYNRAWSYAMGFDPGYFLVHAFALLQCLQDGNPALPRFSTKSAYMVGNCTIS
jgi:hypothetical protein